jgi:hypothetical protein
VSPAIHVLDRRLDDLLSGQRALTADLADLEGDGTYALLASGDRITATRARAALALIADLRQGFEPLDRLLAQVMVERRSGPLEDRTAAELVSILNGASLVVTATVPSDQPGEPPVLATKAVAPQALLDDVEGAITTLRELVAEVDAAWQDFLPRLERVTADADELVAELPRHEAVATARRWLSALSSLVVTDPLGAIEGLAQVEAALAEAAAIRGDATRLHQALATAEATVTEVESVVAAGRTALDRCRVEFVDAPGLLAPLDDDVLTGDRGLRPWLARLERLVARGQVDHAEKGLQRWQGLADQVLVAGRQVVEANTGPTRRRRELQGLMRAALVKGGAAGRAEDPALTQLAGKAEKALDVPCDLRDAEACVGVYLAEVRRSPTPAQAARPAPTGPLLPRPAWLPPEPPESVADAPEYETPATVTPLTWREMSA